MSARMGTVRPRPIQNRRVMSRSSGFSASSKVGTRGSRAIPQMGQVPGSLRTISGCIGQVQTAPVEAAGAAGLVAVT